MYGTVVVLFIYNIFYCYHTWEQCGSSLRSLGRLTAIPRGRGQFSVGAIFFCILCTVYPKCSVWLMSCWTGPSLSSLKSVGVGVCTIVHPWVINVQISISRRQPSNKATLPGVSTSVIFTENLTNGGDTETLPNENVYFLAFQSGGRQVRRSQECGINCPSPKTRTATWFSPTLGIGHS